MLDFGLFLLSFFAQLVFRSSTERVDLFRAVECQQSDGNTEAPMATRSFPEARRNNYQFMRCKVFPKVFVPEIASESMEMLRRTT